MKKKITDRTGWKTHMQMNKNRIYKTALKFKNQRTNKSGIFKISNLNKQYCVKLGEKNKHSPRILVSLPQCLVRWTSTVLLSIRYRKINVQPWSSGKLQTRNCVSSFTSSGSAQWCNNTILNLTYTENTQLFGGKNRNIRHLQLNIPVFN